MKKKKKRLLSVKQEEEVNVAAEKVVLSIAKKLKVTHKQAAGYAYLSLSAGIAESFGMDLLLSLMSFTVETNLLKNKGKSA